ncbi:MAG: hypothetical protein QM734_08240 [Cyclobacteriaceae bacterium]
MKKIIISILLVIYCQSSQAQSSQSLKSVEWLLGKWHRLNTKPGKSGVESWEKKSQNGMDRFWRQPSG